MKEKEMEELAERTASKLFEKIMKYIAIGFILYLVVMVGSFGIHEIKRINEERKAKFVKICSFLSPFRRGGFKILLK